MYATCVCARARAPEYFMVLVCVCVCLRAFMCVWGCIGVLVCVQCQECVNVGVCIDVACLSVSLSVCLPVCDLCVCTLCIPSVHTKSYGQRAFSYSAPTVWNNLSKAIRNSESAVFFKSALKTYLFQLYK